MLEISEKLLRIFNKIISLLFNKMLRLLFLSLVIEYCFNFIFYSVFNVENLH